MCAYDKLQSPSHCYCHFPLINDFERNRKYYFRCYSACWASSLSQKKIKITCETSESLSWSASNCLEFKITQKTLKGALLIIGKPSPNKGKMGFSSYTLLALSYMPFILKVEQQFIFKLYLKISVPSKTSNIFLIFMLVRSLQKANSEWKHSALQCTASEHKGLEALQTKTLWKARGNISKHVRFYWYTYHHLNLRHG